MMHRKVNERVAAAPISDADAGEATPRDKQPLQGLQRARFPLLDDWLGHWATAAVWSERRSCHDHPAETQ